MKSLNEMGREFNEHSGAKGSMRRGAERALEELDECLDAYWNGTVEDLIEEYADVVLSLAGAAATAGLDLDAAIARKHAINLQRKWEPHPTIPGAVRHVKEPKP